MIKIRPPDKKWLIFILFCSSFASQSYGQKLPDFNEIVAKFIKKGEADSLYIGNNYTHRERAITKTLKNGIVAEIEEEHYFVEKNKGELYRKLIEKDGLPVTDSEFKKKDELISIGIELLGRYEFTFVRNEMLDGVKCWVFSFVPRKNLPDIKARDVALNRIVGEIWIGQNDLSFKKIAGHLLSEASISRIIGSAQLHKLDFIAVAKLIENRFAVDYIWAEYIYTVKLFGFVTVINNRHEITEIFYENYERRTK